MSGVRIPQHWWGHIHDHAKVGKGTSSLTDVSKSVHSTPIDFIEPISEPGDAYTINDVGNACSDWQ